MGRSPGGAHGNPLQYSSLESPMDRGAWQAKGCTESDMTKATWCMCTHTCIYSLSHTHTHSHNDVLMSSVRYCTLGGLGAGGRGVEAALPSSGADAGSAVSPGLACGRCGSREHNYRLECLGRVS